jgi:hypothetical protein
MVLLHSAVGRTAPDPACAILDGRAAGGRPYGPVTDSFVGAASCRSSLDGREFSKLRIEVFSISDCFQKKFVL